MIGRSWCLVGGVVTNSKEREDHNGRLGTLETATVVVAGGREAVKARWVAIKGQLGFRGGET